MADLDRMAPADRRMLRRLAEAAGIEADALIPELAAAYLRLLRDAPAVLPRDPLAPVISRAEAAS